MIVCYNIPQRWRRVDLIRNIAMIIQQSRMCILGKEIMNRAHRRLGKLTIGGPEDRRLRSFFGAGVEVILEGWYRMKDQQLIPEGALFVHYLWALMFMKIYSTEGAMCGHAGGVDAKTFRKWVWPMIRAVADLEYTVVSIIC